MIVLEIFEIVFGIWRMSCNVPSRILMVLNVSDADENVLSRSENLHTFTQLMCLIRDLAKL
jgi:hypothetical protein